MLRSLNSGVTGLINHQTRMDVIGNNISNVNTIGYKNRRVTFGESFSQMVKGATRTESRAGGTNAMQIGLGVQVSSVDMITGQGNLNNTGRTFDLAIDGNAFFGVSDGQNMYYTRNGAFQLDAEGYIVLPTNGMVLQGRMADSFGNFPPGTAIGNMKIPMSQQAPAKATTNVEFMRNLPMDGDAEGNVQYTQTFLHAADGLRGIGVNGITDPGKSLSTPLTSLYNSKGDYLNIKEGDVLTIAWWDTPSIIDNSATPKAAEFTFVVEKPPEDGTDWGGSKGNPSVNGPNDWNPTTNPNPAKVYTLADLLAAMNAAIITKIPDAEVRLQSDGSIGFINNGLRTGINPNTGAVESPNDNIFCFQVTSTNPLSQSPLGKAFNFGSYIGPGVGNYEPAGQTTPVVRDHFITRSVNTINGIPVDSNGYPLYRAPNNTELSMYPTLKGQLLPINPVDPTDPTQGYYSVGSWGDTHPGPRVQGTYRITLPADENGALFRWATTEELADDGRLPAPLLPGVLYAVDFNPATGKTTISAGDVVYNPGATPPGYGHPSGRTGEITLDAGAVSSDRLLRPAEQFDKLNEVLTANGDKLGLEEHDTISFDGSVGKDKISKSKNLIFDPETTLFDDVISKIRNDFRLPAEYVDRVGNQLQTVYISLDGNPHTNPMYGSLVVRSMKGVDFSINNLITNAANINTNGIAPTNFKTNMGFEIKQPARDVASFDMPIDIYDDGGTSHTLTVTFTHTGRDGEWEWRASFPGKEIITSGGTGKVFFGSDNTVSSWIFDDGSSQLIVDPNNTSSVMRINLDPGKGAKGLTQYDTDFTAAFRGQNGYGSGALVEVSINEFGLVEGRFSNGTARAIGQIMVVDFANPGGLIDLADCIFTTSANSGDPVWGRPSTQSSSKLKPGALEMSNVDLGMEFTNMITTQRGYQANSRIVTVSDSMLEELVNLKR